MFEWVSFIFQPHTLSSLQPADNRILKFKMFSELGGLHASVLHHTCGLNEFEWSNHSGDDNANTEPRQLHITYTLVNIAVNWQRIYEFKWTIRDANPTQRPCNECQVCEPLNKYLRWFTQQSIRNTLTIKPEQDRANILFLDSCHCYRYML